MRKPDPVTQVKQSSSGGIRVLHTAAAADADIPMVTKRRRKSRPRLPVDDDEESYGAQADEEPLAESRRAWRTSTRAGGVRLHVMTASSRRSLIQDDEERRHSMLVTAVLLCPLNYDATLSNEHLAPPFSWVLTKVLSQDP